MATKNSHFREEDWNTIQYNGRDSSETSVRASKPSAATPCVELLRARLCRYEFLLVMKDTPLVKDLTAEQQLEVAKCFKRVEVKAGQSLHKTAKDKGHLYMIEQGRFAAAHGRSADIEQDPTARPPTHSPTGAASLITHDADGKEVPHSISSLSLLPAPCPITFKGPLFSLYASRITATNDRWRQSSIQWEI